MPGGISFSPRPPSIVCIAVDLCLSARQVDGEPWVERNEKGEEVSVRRFLNLGELIDLENLFICSVGCNIRKCLTTIPVCLSTRAI